MTTGLQFPVLAEEGRDHALVDVLALANRAPFYRTRWRRASPGDGPDALSVLPVITPDEWSRALRRNPRQVVADLPALWTLTRYAGRDLWFPVAHRDLPVAASAAAAAMRLAGIRDGDRILAVLPPAPSIWNGLPYLLLQSDLAVEILPLCVDTVTFKPSLAAFPIARGPKVFLASPVLGADLARLAGALPIWERTVFYEDAAAFEDPTPGAFGNTDTSGTNAAVRLLALPGCPAPIGRCGAGAWHLPAAAALAEIHPRTLAAGARPQVRLLADAPQHERGVLVVTTFTHAAPLVRFVTDLAIRAPGSHSCACGDPSPRFYPGAGPLEVASAGPDGDPQATLPVVPPP
ncbi:MAG: hypothetical protein HY355_02465 [Armatimonadetes bacterium]|nr:hypothetical protein [Armatimonadota bacterium]